MDHIVSIDRLVRAPGFVDLTPEEQDRIVNSKANTRPLPPSWNSSKKQRSYSEWPDRDPTGGLAAPTRDEWQKLCEEERQSTIEIRRAIATAQGNDEESERGQITDMNPEITSTPPTLTVSTAAEI